MAALAFVLSAALAAVHVFAGSVRLLGGIPRSRWLSFGGGISVAYIFIHLLPELAAGQRMLESTGGSLLAAIESQLWLVALGGLVTFYGLERVGKHSRRQTSAGGAPQGTDARVFWLHIGSFAIYNLVIGYLMLDRAAQGVGNLLLFWFAMVLHFFVNDVGLRDHHRERYTRMGRWVLALAVLGGWLLGVTVEVGEAAVAVLVAFIGGGVVLNVMKEELPEERSSSFVAFALGASAYAAVLLAM